MGNTFIPFRSRVRQNIPHSVQLNFLKYSDLAQYYYNTARLLAAAPSQFSYRNTWMNYLLLQIFNNNRQTSCTSLIYILCSYGTENILSSFFHKQSIYSISPLSTSRFMDYFATCQNLQNHTLRFIHKPNIISGGNIDNVQFPKNQQKMNKS